MSDLQGSSGMCCFLGRSKIYFGKESDSMKKSIVLSMMIVVITLMSSLVPAYASQRDSVIRIQIDGETLHIPSNDQQPVIIDGRTLVPLRAVMEALGFTVYWDSGQRAAYLFMDVRPSIMVPLQNVPEQKGYAISIGARHHFHGNLYTSNTRDANGVVITLDVPPQLINGRTMVPLRAIAEAADMDVAWNSANRIAVINTRGANGHGSENNPTIPPVTSPTDNVQPAPPANMTPPAAPAGLVALGNNGQTFVYAGTEPVEIFLAQLDRQGSHTLFARVHVFEVGAVITVRTTHAPALELLEGVGGIHLAVSEVVSPVLELRCFDDHPEFTSPDRGYITRHLGDWEMISVDSHTLSYTANTPGRIYQVWAAGGMTVDIMVVAAGTTSPISNQPPVNDTTGSNVNSNGWKIASSGITLPNRRLTETERQTWIDEYNQMGGATNFELEVVRLINGSESILWLKSIGNG